MNGNPVSLQWKYPPDLIFNEESLLDIILTLRMKIEILEKNEMGNGEIPTWLSDAMQNIANNSEAMHRWHPKDIVILRRDVAAKTVAKSRRTGKAEDEAPATTNTTSAKSDASGPPTRRRPSMLQDRAPSRREALVAPDPAAAKDDPPEPSSSAATTTDNTIHGIASLSSSVPLMGESGYSQDKMDAILEPIIDSIEQLRAESAIVRENSQEAKSSVMRLQAEMKRRDALIQARNSKHEGNVKILMDKLTHDLRACVTQNELIGFEQKSLILLKQESHKLSDEYSGLFSRTQEEIHMVRSMQEDINSSQAEALQKTQNRVEIMSDKIEEILKTQEKFAKMLDELRRNSQAEHQHIQTIITQQGVMKEKLQAVSDKQCKGDQFTADLAQAFEDASQNKQKAEDKIKEIIELRAEALHNEIKRLDDIFVSCSVETLSVDVKRHADRIDMVEHTAMDNRKKISDLAQHVGDTEVIYNTNFTTIYEGIERVSRDASENLRKDATRLGAKIKENQDAHSSLIKIVVDNKLDTEKNFATMRTKVENHQLETEGMKVHTEAALSSIKEKLSYLEQGNLSFRTEYDAAQTDIQRTFVQIATETASTQVILDSVHATLESFAGKQDVFNEQIQAMQVEYRTEIGTTATRLNDAVIKEGERTEALYAAFTEKQTKFAEMVAKASTRNMTITTLNKELDMLCDAFVAECWKFEISARQEGKVAATTSRADNNGTNRKQFSERQQNFLIKNAQFFADLVCAKAEYEVLKVASNKEIRGQTELDAKMVRLQLDIVEKLNTRMLAKVSNNKNTGEQFDKGSIERREVFMHTLANMLGGAISRRTLSGGSVAPEDNHQPQGDGHFLETVRLQSQARPSTTAGGRPSAESQSTTSPFNKRRDTSAATGFGVRAESPVLDADARRMIQSPHSNAPYVYRGGFRIPNRHSTINIMSDAFRDMHHDDGAAIDDFVTEDAGVHGQTEPPLASSSVSLPAL
ncbi:hypothetical protein SPRG_02557 [Saprolegnia parasitica CBS 223.65]|uniref:Uncharacterized protein n=1 Tax=Saprolegnia parasitica (strain CBS 223.65) TaxID=695850 RepID=A0A067CQ88_SAPPC|nr:hypothetical protein SPRG_02557 [Saprolegnia parasitica CBS 223.65]KDO32864.1 hypothetical protein SPRG_02557 [Saprolegnia parasitica CBS 223.65]|eukprot:XP_012196516.1 hypothetical protein SPRG_02557 [Saprolegnia parasitica CBS 223.65]